MESQEAIDLKNIAAAESRRNRDHDYLAYHARRFDYVLNTCIEICPDRKTRVLDIGRSELSRMLLDYYDHVTTLGFPINETPLYGHELERSGRSGNRQFSAHVVFDLNDAQTVRCLNTEHKFDLIVFAETIEHLHTAPELVLRLLKTSLQPGGYIVCQTPNAASLHKRITLLCGKHPYERIHLDPTAAGHFREYTKQELIEFGSILALDVVKHEYAEYFGALGGPLRRLALAIQRAASALVPSLSRGQTVVYCMRG